MSSVLCYAVAFVLLAALFWLPGALALGLVSVRTRDVLGELRGSAEICLGLCFWILAVFALCAAGALAPGPVMAVALAGIGTLALAASRRRAAGAVRRPAPHGRRLLPLALAVLLLAPLFVRALSPTVDWDASTYHLTLPRLFLAAGGFRPVELNVYAKWPLDVELLFALALLAGDHVLATLVHFGFGLGVVYALARGCARLRHPASPWLAGALFLANPVVLAELRAAYVDLAFAFFFLTGFLFMERALDDERPQPWLRLAGLCAGLLAGVKVTGVGGAAVIGALYLPRLVAAARARKLGRSLGGFLASFALPALALWAPWVLRSWWLTGDPFYPFLHDWLGGPEWSAALGRDLAEWQRSIGMGRSPLDYLLLPIRVVLQGGPGYSRFDGRIGVFWLAVAPLALILGLRVPLARRALAGAGLYFALWSASSQQMRFLIPALPLLALAAAAASAQAIASLGSQRLRRLARLVEGAFAAALCAWIAFQSMPPAARLLERYRAGAAALQADAVHPVWSFVNRELPSGARILLLNTNQGFFCEREYLADSFFEASQIADWLRPATSVADLRSRLAERGITHVLLENRDWGIDYGPALRSLLADPEQAEVLFQSDDDRFGVLRLR